MPATPPPTTDHVGSPAGVSASTNQPAQPNNSPGSSNHGSPRTPRRGSSTVTLAGRTRSTLVETVSINYEHFSESFLTCPTCLCVYDEDERTPKLLPCSHTACLACLHRIASTGIRGTFRCPICRDIVPLPSGGVVALTPAFVVNQLLELISQQPREVLPQCATHTRQELLFCEPCDSVFCPVCEPGAHQDRAATSQHTVLPFSVAIKRMMEILNHKAQVLKHSLSQAEHTVQEELRSLNRNEQRCVDELDASFQQLFLQLEQRRQQLLRQLRDTSRRKRQELEQQLEMIRSERLKAENTCTQAQQQMEVRGVTAKIASVSEQQVMCESLSEPRQNAFIKYETKHNDALQQLEKTLGQVGRVSISSTLPSQCVLTCEPVIAQLRCTATLTTYDYLGHRQIVGGDPVTVAITCEDGSLVPSRLVDHADGTYTIHFTARTPGYISLHVSIFHRPVRGSALRLEVNGDINPLQRLGTSGSGLHDLRQPVCVRVLPDKSLLVLDTGNRRLKRLSPDGATVEQLITGPALEGQSCTGLWVGPQQYLYLTNWRTRSVHVLDPHGHPVRDITHPDLQEPTSVAVTSHGEVVVADNCSSRLFMFNEDGSLKCRFGTPVDDNITTSTGSPALRRSSQVQLASPEGPQPSGGVGSQPPGGAASHPAGGVASPPPGGGGQPPGGGGGGGVISDVAVSPGSDQVLVADHRLQLFSRDGSFLRQLGGGRHLAARGRYGGVCFDPRGLVLATRSQPGSSLVQVLSVTSGDLLFVITSLEDRLKRPCHLSVDHDSYYLFVADLGNDCIKKYRYA